MKSVKQMLEEEKALEDKINGTHSDQTPPETTEPTTPDNKDNLSPTQSVEVGTSTPESGKPSNQEGEDWEKRYKGLRASREQKLYDAQQDLSSAHTQITDLQDRIEELEKLAVPKEVPIASLLSEEEKDTLGEAAIGVIEKVTRSANQGKITSLEEELAGIRKNNKEASKARARLEKEKAYGTFSAQLNRIVPTWAQLNEDPGFLKYLNDADLDGAPRFDKIRQAERRGDAASVGRFMNDYIATKKDKLADLVTPNASITPTAPTSSKDSNYLTMEQINAHYNKHARGGYKGKEKEFLEMEHKIDTYATEGKIKR